jgi:hypothetical protein
MRKLSALAILTVTAVSTAASAAPPACKDLLTDWFAAVKDVDAGNKGKKEADWDPLPPLDISAAAGHLDCLKDDVLVINGDTMVNMKPLVTCSKVCSEDGKTACTADGTGCTCNKFKTDDCKLDYAGAAAKAAELMGGAGSWDELVIFGAQISPSSNPPAPLFYRDGYAPGTPAKTDPMTMMMTPAVPAKAGVNEVLGIGLDKMDRVAGHPYVGYIAAGGTNQAAKFADGGTDGWLKKLKKDDFKGAIAAYGPCGKAPKLPSDAPADQAAPGICFPSFYNYFDALAQATGALYGPYLKGPKEMTKGQELTQSPVIISSTAYTGPTGPVVGASSIKTGFLKKVKVFVIDPMTMMPKLDMAGMPVLADQDSPNDAYFGANPRYWNSLLDTQGSLFAGNTYRNNGNGTYETTKPSAFYGINVPFPAGWNAGTNLSGSQILRFQPLDLYAMGLISKEELLKTTQYKSFMGVSAAAVYKDGRANAPTSFDKIAGPQMGQRTGLIVRPGSADGSAWLKTADILTANGERMPAFGAAPKFIKQLWVVVSKPTLYVEQDTKALASDPTMKDQNDLMMRRAQQLQNLDVVTAWRRQFSAYYYMLTGYRGRVVNTVDGVDDNAYFEFGLNKNDEPGFTADGGVEVEQQGWESASASGPDMKTVLRFTNVGAGQGITYMGMNPGLRITGAQNVNKVPVNSVSVRMRVPVSASAALKGATATLTLPGLDPITIPAPPAALVADGAWHTYVAPLPVGNDTFKAGSFNSFSFSPTSKDYQGEGIEVEFIRIANAPSLKDADKIGQRCGACDAKNLSANAKKQCTMLCAGHDDNYIAQVDVSDGFIDAEDNCPTVYNPDQADGNGDGVGDACEDFDADGVVNAWDNCPTVTNSRQVDANGNGVGDVCDGSQATPCFLKPDSLGGPVSSGPGALFGVLLAGSVGALVIRRRRRR